jgi:hypothetical protein
MASIATVWLRAHEIETIEARIADLEKRAGTSGTDWSRFGDPPPSAP